MKPIFLLSWLGLGALLFPAPRAHGANAPFLPLAVAPTIAITTQKTQWLDAKRKRVLPVTLHFPLSGAGPFPLLIISHGLGGTRDSLDYLVRFWASHGYVCAQLQHIGSDDSVWRGAAKPLEAMRAATKDPKKINDRPLDVKFAIDEMLKLNANAKSALFRRINTLQIGAAGHSFGAFTAQAVAGRFARQKPDWRDPRVSASIALSAPSQSLEASRAQYSAFKTPFYVLTGTRDDSLVSDSKAGDRRVPFDAIQGVEGYLLILNDATHATLGGGRRSGPKDALHRGLIQASTLLFWDAYLKKSTAAKTEMRAGGFAETLGKEGIFEVK